MNENMKLRQLLWLNHGCEIGGLYGDDGEMQCSKCMIDFKRAPAEDIEKRFRGEICAACWFPGQEEKEAK